MKMKRFIAGLLSLIMMISMIGVVDVNAAETTDSSYGEELASGLTTGFYTDDSADANTDYVYTVVGDDGSVAEISTTTMDNVQEGYWKVQWDDGTLNVEDGEYLIVSWKFDNSAVKSIENCPYDTFTGSKLDVFISADNLGNDFKWNISKSGNGYIIESCSNTGHYMQIIAPNRSGDDATEKPVTIGAGADGKVFEIMESYNGTWDGYVPNTVFFKHNEGFLNKNGNDCVGTWDQAGNGNCFYLYKKGYRVKEDVLAEVVAGVTGTELDYSYEEWKNYKEALVEVYSACDDPAEANAELEDLVAAITALKIADTKSVYVKHTGTNLPETGKYLIVTDRNENGALANERASLGKNFAVDTLDIVNGKTVQYVDLKYVWTITKETDNSGYEIKDKDGKCINIKEDNSPSGLELVDTKRVMQITSQNADTFSIGNGSQYLHCYNYDDRGLGTYSDATDPGSLLYLYKEYVDVTDLAIAEVENSVTGTEDTYTTASWNAYQNALTAVKGVDFATEVEAEDALATLREAAESLSAIDESVLDAYYVKETPRSSTPIVPDGVYAIVGAHIHQNTRYSANKAVKNDGSFNYIDVNSYITNDKLTEVNEVYEWSFTNISEDGSGNIYYIQPANNKTKYLNITNNTGDRGVVLQDAQASMQVATGAPAYNLGVCIGNGTTTSGTNGWMNHRGGSADTAWVGAWDTYQDTGSTFYLYKKAYSVSDSVIEALTALVDAEENYVTGYTEYQETLEKAQEAKETPKEAYEAYKALVSAIDSLVLVTEQILPAEDPNNNTEVWTRSDTLEAQQATLTVDAENSYDRTEEAIVFNLTTATGFEVLASCSANTGMLMTIVKDADGDTVRAYLVDTYYPGTGHFENVPVVRDMDSPAGGSVEVYGCLVASTVGNRVPAAQSTFSMRAARNTVSTDDIVLGLLQEFGLEEELSVSDVEVSYMDEGSVLNGGKVQGVSTYAVSLADTGATTNAVYVEGCRLYREGNGVAYTAVSELVAGGEAIYITPAGGSEEEFVLSTYQYTGPQNEIYLEAGEVIAIGLSGETAGTTYHIRVKANDGTESYELLAVNDNTLTYVNDSDSTVALGVIRSTSTSATPSAALYVVMTSEQTETVLARLNIGDILEMLNPFVDIEKAAYYYDAVLWAVKEKITDGWTETLFAPDMGCTRGQVVTFLWRAAGMPKVTGVENPFTDVAENAYYYDAVLWAVEQGITDGWTETLFAPDMECTRGQIVTFLWRAEGEPEAARETAAFVDLQADAFYKEAVLWAVENGVTEGVDATHFEPESTCLRGQIVTFLYRAVS